MDLPTLEASATLLQTVKYVNVASCAILFYDYFLTLEMEVEYIWKATWGMGKVLFLLARYPTFVDVPVMLYYALTPNLPFEKCANLYSAASWLTAFGIGMAEAVLVLRTFALWGNNRKILVFLLGLYTAIYIPVVVILVIFLRSLRWGAPPLPTVVGCYPTQGSVILFADFALLMVNETIVMVLTIWIGVKRFRHSRNPLVITLYRDGVFYFVYLFLISAGNIIVLLAGPPEYVDLLNTFQRVMHSVLSTRILLHVRATARDGYVRDMTPLSNLRFESATGKGGTTITLGSSYETAVP
ncbi:hypothetical protein LshimejAT787_2600580 [Lyophyllum shimeji]|uniref:DUF6533 domain-containing protein n=1 Tax=Lyophyllum shimeji TaxID=47721 RepID=A0A9P3Q154_LYOSH|nr:hypothetical protein LshimejAT787_2600580 [Lyophyllum shimeji]